MLFVPVGSCFQYPLMVILRLILGENGADAWARSPALTGNLQILGSTPRSEDSWESQGCALVEGDFVPS